MLSTESVTYIRKLEFKLEFYYTFLFIKHKFEADLSPYSFTYPFCSGRKHFFHIR